MLIKYVAKATEVKFSQIKEGECFYVDCILYIKLLKSDLNVYGIEEANALNLTNARLMFFLNDEIVNEAIKIKERY